jgi:C4-dicarboxylate transporter DctM subunit
MASNLFVAAKLGKVNMREMLKPLMPMLFGVAIPVMLLVTYIPALSTWLPNLVMGR